MPAERRVGNGGNGDAHANMRFENLIQQRGFKYAKSSPHNKENDLKHTVRQIGRE